MTRPTFLHSLTRWPGEAGAGLVVTVIIAESLMALLMLLGAEDHLLWAVTRPTAAVTYGPAVLAVVWLLAAMAGGTLATTLGGRVSAAWPAGILPAASMALMAWYFRQPAGLIGMLVFGPLAGCLLGSLAGKAVRRLDKSDARALARHEAGI